jgi:hypothetical protein
LFTLAQIILCLKPNGVATKAPPITTMTLLATCLPQAGYFYCFKISFVLQINFEQQTNSEKLYTIIATQTASREAVALSCVLGAFLFIQNNIYFK